MNDADDAIAQWSFDKGLPGAYRHVTPVRIEILLPKRRETTTVGGNPGNLPLMVGTAAPAEMLRR